MGAETVPTILFPLSQRCSLGAFHTDRIGVSSRQWFLQMGLAGRDYLMNCVSMLATSGGLPGGQVVGSTESKGYDFKEGEYVPPTWQQRFSVTSESI